MAVKVIITVHPGHAFLVRIYFECDHRNIDYITNGRHLCIAIIFSTSLIFTLSKLAFLIS